jgi:RecQ family ATP-dependent DNA helicase
MLNTNDQIVGIARDFLPNGTLHKAQIQSMAAILANRNVLLIAPTGFGKSLCYQVPARILGKPTLVISPLIALMNDQASAVKECGFKAACLHSGIREFDQWRAVSLWIIGELDILFTSPEKLMCRQLLDSLALNSPGLIVIDEAHCISTWGARFRPVYRQIGERLQKFDDARMLAMTATATFKIERDIREVFTEREFEIVRVPYRSGQTTISVQREPFLQNRLSFIKDLAADCRHLPMVVFCATKKLADSVARSLSEKSLQSYSFHAGMTVAERERTRTLFQSSQEAILVATSAFEMGVNDRRIRSVVHCGLPASFESYVQGLGRCGRDGKSAKAVLLYDDRDLDLHEAMKSRSESLTASLAQDVYKFAESRQCRVALLNEYFHGDAEIFSAEVCGICDNCRLRSSSQQMAAKQRELAIKRWRRKEAQISEKPAFQILTDREVARIALSGVDTLSALQTVAGVRLSSIHQYGQKIITAMKNGEF